MLSISISLSYAYPSALGAGAQGKIKLTAYNKNETAYRSAHRLGFLLYAYAHKHFMNLIMRTLRAEWNP